MNSGPNSARNNKNYTNRNITPNFLRFKRIYTYTQASLKVEKVKNKDSIPMVAKEADQNLATLKWAFKSQKKESYTLVP